MKAEISSPPPPPTTIDANCNKHSPFHPTNQDPSTNSTKPLQKSKGICGTNGPFKLMGREGGREGGLSGVELAYN